MKLVHPDSELTVDADPDHADMYRSQGWVDAPKKTSTVRASGKSGTAPHTTTKKEEA